MKKVTVKDLETMGVVTPRASGPFRFGPDTPVSEIAQCFRDNKIGSVPIVDENNVHVGVLSERDMATKLVAEARDSDLVVAKEIMRSGDLARVREDDTMDYAIEQMKQRGARHVTVVDSQNRVINFISMRDFLVLGQEINKNLRKKQIQIVKLQIAVPSILVICALTVWALNVFDSKYLYIILSTAFVVLGIATVLTTKKTIEYDKEAS